MTTQERLEYNRQNIAAFRANGGQIPSFGDALVLLLSTKGAKSGLRRTTPLVYLPDEAEPNRVYVFASAAGAEHDPTWLTNLRANPDDVTVEIGADTRQARPEVLAGAARDAIFGTQAARDPAFAGYQTKTARRIPVVALTLGPRV